MDPHKNHPVPDAPNQHQLDASLQYPVGYPPSQHHANPHPHSPYMQSIPPPNFMHNFNPFASPNNYQQYSQSPASYQGLQQQASLGHSPHEAYAFAATRPSPLLRPVALFGGMGNTSSNGSESATPRPGREGTQTIPVEESDSSEEDGRKVAHMSWTEEENRWLASSWLKHSVDCERGNGKKSAYYWKQVADEFNSNRPAVELTAVASSLAMAAVATASMASAVASNSDAATRPPPPMADDSFRHLRRGRRPPPPPMAADNAGAPSSSSHGRRGRHLPPPSSPSPYVGERWIRPPERRERDRSRDFSGVNAIGLEEEEGNRGKELRGRLAFANFV